MLMSPRWPSLLLHPCALMAWPRLWLLLFSTTAVARRRKQPRGGWSGKVGSGLETERCTIPRIDAAELAEGELRRRIGPEAQMPAIIAGAFSPAADPAWANWSKASLLRRSGEAVLRTGASEQIGFAGVAIAEQPVKELLGGGKGEGETFLAFDREFLDATGAEYAPEPPTWLAEAVPNRERLLSLGAAGAGLIYHTHGAAYIVVAFGAKRWFLQPPSWRIVSAWRKISSLQYARDIHPHLPEDQSPMECVQRPGEIVCKSALLCFESLSRLQCH